MIYNIVSGVISIFIPILVLIFCNLCLIRALRDSHRMQKNCRANRPPHASVNSGGHRITATLIALIVFFITMVTPSELLTFYLDQRSLRNGRGGLSSGGDDSGYFYMKTAVVVTNSLLLLNFATNVILYCTINANFRRVLFGPLCSTNQTQELDHVTRWGEMSVNTRSTVTCRPSEFKLIK